MKWVKAKHRKGRSVLLQAKSGLCTLPYSGAERKCLNLNLAFQIVTKA